MDTKWTPDDPRLDADPEGAAFAARILRDARAWAAMLTVKEVAGRLRVSTAAVYGLVERGELGHVRLFNNSIRVNELDLATFVRHRR